jgi:hypothetical protein
MLTRADVNVYFVPMLTDTQLPPAAGKPDAFPPHEASDKKAILNRVIENGFRMFNPAENMIRSAYQMPVYHTTLPDGAVVHQTRESLYFAVALLDTDNEQNHAIAARIFQKVIGLQDTNPKSRTYGIWPWFLEESLSRMAPPDWNWADFCGAQLLEALLSRRDRLPAGIADAMDRAVVHAARSIECRDVPPSYTNITIMGCFVTLAAAESYGIADLFAYGMKRLRSFFNYTQEQGGSFSEYNSPTYTIVALKELLRIRRYVRDPEAMEMAEALYDLAWEEIASHFHAPSGQWGGPHSRSYDIFLPKSVASLLKEVTDGRFPADDIEPDLLDEHYRMTHSCPARLIACFLELNTPRTLRKSFLRGTPDLIGTTYLTPEFVFSTANHCEFWNQRRPFLAYWGRPDAPVCLRARFLHDGYDFSAAQFFSVQSEGNAIFGVAFATDGGDTHLCLDPLKDGTFRAKDLRLRFEFTGLDPKVHMPSPKHQGDFVNVNAGPIQIELSIPFAEWEDEEVKWESGSDGNSRWMDVVLYSGDSRIFRLADLKKASMAAVVGISTAFAPPAAISVETANGRCQISWKGLQLRFPVLPDTQVGMRETFAEAIEETDVETQDLRVVTEDQLKNLLL